MALNINGTTGISGVDGSVSAPAVTGTDSNTGITFPSADTIKFSTGGVERMQITNSGVSGTGISAGKILQVVNTLKTSSFNTTDTNYSSHPYGVVVTGFAASITPSATSSKILIITTFGLTNSNTDFYAYAFLYKGTSSSDLLGAVAHKARSGTLEQNSVSIHRLDSPNTTSQVTYQMRLSAENHISKIGRQGTSASSDNEKLADCSMTLMEVAA